MENSPDYLENIRIKLSPHLPASIKAYNSIATVGFGNGLAYTADNDTHVVNSVNVTTGAVTVIAGLSGTSGGSDGVGTAARFYGPNGLSYDGALHALIVSDEKAHTMREVDIATASVSTVAGVYLSGANVDGAATSGARLKSPRGRQALHPAQRDRYFMSIGAAAGSCAMRVLRVSASPTVETVAGSHTDCALVDGVGLAARFVTPVGLSVSPDGKAIYAEQHDAHRVRRVDPVSFVVTTVLGNGAAAVSSNDDPLLASLSTAIGTFADLDGTRLHVIMFHAIAAVRLNDD